MNAMLGLLAFAGIVAVLRRMVFAAFRFARGAVEAFVAREIGSTRANRGDITGLTDAREARARARSHRIRAGLELLAWSSVLAGAGATDYAREVYAALSLLWLPLLVRRMGRQKDA